MLEGRQRLKGLSVLILIIIMTSWMASYSVEAADGNSLRILYINSYHEGYKWSDDIRNAMKATFSYSPFDVKIETIYLDTQRMPVNNPVDYYQNIADNIAYKNRFRKFDMVITSDDAAFRFMKEYGWILGEDIPHLFCGVNDLAVVGQSELSNTGGVIEYLDMEETLNLIGDLQPQVKNIYYLADDSITGQAALRSFLDISKSFEGHYNFYDLEGPNFDATLKKAQELPEDAAIFYLLHYFDKEDRYLSYDEGISALAESTTVPVYTMWEFYMNEGTIGGKITSGIDQGRTVAGMAVDYFSSSDYDFHITDENLNKYIFDYQVLKKHNIDLTNLPAGSDIVNYEIEGSQNILILHSYNQGFQWTDNIDAGIRSIIDLMDCQCEVYTEYMDLKRVGGGTYLYDYENLFVQKYGDLEFDLILTSDDGAFDFAMNYARDHVGYPPVVFSGVNYLSADRIQSHEGYTGVMESYDVKGTIDAILSLQPEVTRLLVINDQTTTGVGNRKNVEAIENEYMGEIQFIYTEALSMTELVELVAEQGSETAILLMSFNRDRANNNFTYAQGIQFLKEASKVPMYGVWDFYLGNGIVGGFLTDGYEQGRQAGELGRQIIKGSDASKLPIIVSSPNRYQFDYAMMKQFGLRVEKLPEGAQLINGEKGFLDAYGENPRIFNIIFLLMAVAVVAVLFLIIMLRYSVKMNTKIHHLASYDHLTEVLNRGSGIKELEAYLKNPNSKGSQGAICFIDLNGLKSVNDHYGHGEGDHFIKKTVEVIKSVMKAEDIICRMGGDEFMVVLKMVSEEESKSFGDRLKAALEEASAASDKDYAYSVSLGLNHFKVSDKINVTDVIERADTLMYRDKAAYRQKKR